MPRNYIALPPITSPAPFGGPKIASNSGVPGIPQPKRKGRVLTGAERNEYHNMALDAARRNSVPEHLMVQTVQSTSGFNPTARAGGVGLAQVPLATAQFDPFDNQESLDQVAKKLRLGPFQ